jgi:hypothetical protein
MTSFEIVCEHCGSRYELPIEMRERARGALLACAVCLREWTPLPADPRGGPRGTPFALHSFLRDNPYRTPAAAAPSARSTTQALRPSGAAVAGPNLRVVASGPGLELDAVFELGDRAFLIGSQNAHLELFHAALPEHAIRVRAAVSGLEIEGVDGFLVPIGPMSVAKGRIEPGSRLDLVLSPYRVALEATASPGGPIRAIEDAAAPAPPAPPQPVAPAPAPPAPPAADVNSTVRGLSAFGFDTRRFSNPLDELEVGLLGLDPPVAGETLWIRKSPSLVGRTGGDVVIADSRVSGKHAQIDILGVDQNAIKDLASTNGTTVNDRPASTTRLKDGDVVGFGGVRLRFIARPKPKRA